MAPVSDLFDASLWREVEGFGELADSCVRAGQPSHQLAAGRVRERREHPVELIRFGIHAPVLNLSVENKARWPTYLGQPVG